MLFWMALIILWGLEGLELKVSERKNESERDLCTYLTLPIFMQGKSVTGKNVKFMRTAVGHQRKMGKMMMMKKLREEKRINLLVMDVHLCSVLATEKGNKNKDECIYSYILNKACTSATFVIFLMMIFSCVN